MNSHSVTQLNALASMSEFKKRRRKEQKLKPVVRLFLLKLKKCWELNQKSITKFQISQYLVTWKITNCVSHDPVCSLGSLKWLPLMLGVDWAEQEDDVASRTRLPRGADLELGPLSTLSFMLPCHGGLKAAFQNGPMHTYLSSLSLHQHVC